MAYSRLIWSIFKVWIMSTSLWNRNIEFFSYILPLLSQLDQIATINHGIKSARSPFFIHMSEQQIKAASVVSLLLSAYGNIRYLVGRTSPLDDNSPINVGETPFTANVLLILGYWAVLYLLQITFLTKVLWPDLDAPGGNATTKHVDTHFIGFNVGSFIWSLLFAKQHYILAEIVLILNLVNISVLYFKHKTFKIQPLTTWVYVHLAGVAFPFSWLLYAIFWNGAVVFHSTKLFGRIVANIFIWDFLLIPGAFLLLFEDWGVGLSSAALTFALAIGQFFTKVFALQWLFAFIISGLLFVLSIGVAVKGSVRPSGETAPLLSDSQGDAWGR